MDARSTGAGRFITLEGPDGAGKSEQATRLADALRAGGSCVTLTREPGGTPLGERIRELLLRDPDLARSPGSDALLFNAARAQLVRDVIRPALARGEVVVCDRFAESTLAYQGYGSGMDLDSLRHLEAFATGGLRPDLIVLLDLPVEEGLARRASGAQDQLTRFERSSAHDTAFHERVRQGYLALAAAEPERWRVISAAAAPDDVARAVAAAVGASEPEAALLRINR